MAVTAGSIAVFGETITDPVEIVARIDNVWVTAIGAVTFVIATIGINVVANFVSASYDLANVAPEHIDFRRGGLISAVVAVLITPWHLYSSPAAINYFLGGLGALLGPLFGIIFIDYFLVRRQQVVHRRALPRRPAQPLLLLQGLEPQGAARLRCRRRRDPAVALLKPMADAAPFSWFIGVAVAAVLYYVISERDIRQVELANAVETEQITREGEPA